MSQETDEQAEYSELRARVRELIDEQRELFDALA